ncbi:MAG: SPOR domain-containing protein [Saprospiraceae bacterium]
MGRTLKIAVYVALLFLAYLWIATVAKSCNNTDSADIDTEQVDDYANDDEEGFEDEFFDDEETYSENEMGGGVSDFEEEEDESPIDYTEVDDIIERKSTPKVTPAKKESPKKTYVNNNNTVGNYLLLAGSYLIEDNARVMVNKLKKIGYTNAEIVVFDMSQYYSVCAGRYTGLSKAQQGANSLKRKGVDSYVHTKQ